MLTSCFLGDEDGLQQALDDTYAHFEASRTEEIAAETASLYLDLALPPALQGDVDTTLRLINKWFREAEALDATAYISNMVYACRTLAIVNAVTEAVDCLRLGFTEPSYMESYTEPLVPYYDPIRDTPEFQALQAEFQ